MDTHPGDPADWSREENRLFDAALDGDTDGASWERLRARAAGDGAMWERFAEAYRVEAALRSAVKAVIDVAETTDVAEIAGGASRPPVAGVAPRRRDAGAWLGWAAALLMVALHLSSIVGTADPKGPHDPGRVDLQESPERAGSLGSAARGRARSGFVMIRPKDGSGLRVGRMAVDDLGRPSVVPVVNRGVARVESM